MFLLRFLVAFAVVVVAARSEAQNFPSEILAVSPSALIDIASSDDVVLRREGLNKKIFKSSALDTKLMPSYLRTYPMEGSWWEGKPNLASIQVWVSGSAKGFTSQTWRFTPKKFRNDNQGKCGFIIAGGHDQVAAHAPFQTLLLKLVEDGCEVVTIDMPLNGKNPHPVTVDMGQWKVQVENHNDLHALKSKDFNPLRLFMDPPLAAVNAFYARGITNIGMFGLSGGGWTVDLYAALDDRVDISYSLSGSMPMYMRSWVPPRASLGDWEQMEVPTLGVGYLDLYVLASAGRGRRHVNLYIVNDSCCFGGENGSHFSHAVSEAVASAGAGSYSVVLDTTVNKHTVSDWAASWVASDMVSVFVDRQKRCNSTRHRAK